NACDIRPTNGVNTWELRAAGADASFGTGDDVAYHLSVTPTSVSGTGVVLRIDDGPLAPGHYRFTANSTLGDRAGNPLDGNANGVGGDAYTLTFDVSQPSNVLFESRNNDTLLTSTALVMQEEPAGSGHGMKE